MATLNDKPRSFEQLAKAVYAHLDSEKTDAARAKHEDFWSERMKHFGLVRVRPEKDHPDWWPRKGAK